MKVGHFVFTKQLDVSVVEFLSAEATPKNTEIFLLSSKLISRCELRILNGYFAKGDIIIPSGWFHFALVFHGPEEGQGITVYMNGTPATSTSL